MTETAPALPDEDTFVVPTAWRRHLHPRRGGTAGTKIKLDPGAVDTLRKRAVASDRIGRVLARLTEPELVEESHAYLRGDASPVGAAAVATILARDTKWSSPTGTELFADAWTLAHGIVFAAAAAAELPRMHLTWTGNGARPLEIAFREEGDTPREIWFTALLRRVRSLLAVADDDVYQDAVAELANSRRDRFQQMVACYLVPTRQDWVDELVADIAAADERSHGDWSLLACSSTSIEQLEIIRARTDMEFQLHSLDAFCTVTEGVGPSSAPILAKLFDTNRFGGSVGAGIRKHIPNILACLPTDEAFGLMLARLHKKEMRAALLTAMKRYPVRALRLLARASSAPAGDPSATAELLRDHVLAHAELTTAVKPTLPADVCTAIDELVGEQDLVQEASQDALPRLLVDPPWTRKRKAVKPVVIAGLTPPTDSRIDWQPDERKQWGNRGYSIGYQKGTTWPERLDPLVAGQHDDPGREAHLLFGAPKDLALPLVPHWRPRRVRERDITTIKLVVGRFGLDALPAMLHIAKSSPGPCGELLLPFFDRDVAVLMADWLARLAKARPFALAWFERHGPAAAAFLIPDALGKPGAARRGAEAALRELSSAGHRDAIVDAARGYGEQAAQAIETMLADEPEEKPVKVPTIGDWAAPGRLPRILLEDGRVLPLTAVQNFVTMLAMSKPEAPYPGLDDVLRACEPRSLAKFGWALFQRWQEVGEPAKDNWALSALAWLGDDETVRALTPIIRAWPGESGHSKAVAGLDVLAAIGTEFALMQLHGIAQKVKFSGLMTRAKEKITEVAERLGLTTDRLADRLVPTFGLDGHGSLTLDYGPRKFTVGFDEHLKPYVRDEDGGLLKTLPKPRARDDQDLAPEAHQRFADLKKDVRAVAAEQIKRFERAMVTQRSWPVDEFRSLLVHHPLLWHIVRRLLWTSDGIAFRLAEDRTPADLDDNTLTLPDTAQVRIAHPALLADTLDAWSEVFADYEILQPFPQLARPVHTLTEDEKGSTDLKRFCDATVPTGKFFGLTRHGWDRDDIKDNGLEEWVCRAVPGDRVVVVDLHPGIYVGSPDAYPEQTITGVWIGGGPVGYRPVRKNLTFAELDPVTVSELLAELTELTS